MKKKILFLNLVFILFLCSCSPAATSSVSMPTTSKMTDAVSGATLNRYRTNEIREYQGIRLDPAIGPRDNSIQGIQQVDMAAYRLTVNGLVDHALELAYADVLKMNPAERKITLHCVEGWQATILWKGIILAELFQAAAVKPEANTVIFYCADGYTTSLPLATILDNILILAYNANGLPLPAEMGYPFIFIAEDKLGYKWARWITRIELSNNSGYRGFWESRGYPNEAGIR